MGVAGIRKWRLCAATGSIGDREVRHGSASASAPTIAALRQAMQRDEASSEQLILRALDAVERHALLNAFITVDRQGALSRARQLDGLRGRGEVLGPLHGIPLAVKDNIHVSGLPNTAGTPLLKSFFPGKDAPAVARLKAAGAIVIGKANMHELAFGITSRNAAFGTVGNACHPGFIAGGSSGGTAAAVALRMAVAGLGTDTGGSCRIPAALNDIVGFRPTGGRYPAGGITSISSTRDTIGPMARNVEDAALLDGIMAAGSGALPHIDLHGLRIGIPKEHFHENLQPEVGAAVEDVLVQLGKAGVKLVRADLAGIGGLNGDVGFPIVLFEARLLLKQYLDAYVPGKSLRLLADSTASPDVRDLMGSIVRKAISESEYRRALHHFRPLLKRLYADCFAKHKVEAILFPTTPLTARPIGEVNANVALNGQSVPTFATYIRNTDPGSNANVPGLSIPLAAAEGCLPVGIEIDGPEGSDRRLLAIGAAIERLVQDGEHAKFNQRTRGI
ncbi:MAG: indoleacetamide hydrolase [Gammaproteobacteria bacterium]|nr:indoleacetamide hydrolase [Gammaproteobacteria bacterium]